MVVNYKSNLAMGLQSSHRFKDFACSCRIRGFSIKKILDNLTKLKFARLSINLGGGGQPDFSDFSDFSDPDFEKISFHIGKIGKKFFANIILSDHFRAYVAS